jgi:3-methyladenine DNA glycosylase AlkD
VSADRVLVASIRQSLREAADPQRAPGMQAYMKSAMPYLGVPVPQVRAVVRAALRERPVAHQAVLRDTALALWRRAGHREERYAATALLGAPAVQHLRTTALLDLYRELIVDGAWWDHVDELAHRVGDLLVDDPVRVRPQIESWIASDDLWLRRVAIICQVGTKHLTDRALLSDAILAAAHEREFFLRKAIGWGLRDYARIDPGWVRKFVAEHADVLSPLSRREALKHLGEPAPR